jgi:hypothetical protein
MKPQTNLLRDCAKRTPIHKPDSPVAEAFAAVLLFAVMIIANFL